MSKSDFEKFATTRHIRDHCLCLKTQRVARVLARHFDEAFRPLGLTNGQFSLLNAINRPEPPTMGSVALLLAMDRTTLTAALKALERRGLVAVSQDPEDRRSRRLRLTEEGRELLDEATPIWRDTHAEVDALIAQTDGEKLPAAIDRITEALQD
ncbi:MarR family transcriptional regulator [Hoeflea sp. WL0058]|uniref:MarR family transcriptional regulator n=1 Tax=Flavimaribacter sediminis TaxID=2865987 RepID=A0AAE2ZSP1_9HYPH|nr:MarR family transcriptional regulator [Flavimaribacter sediminis]MBW8640242.1 MarR family transcriptional regulator [Flavimaribacter sediminis]